MSLIHYYAQHKETGEIEIWGTIDESLWDHHQGQLPDHEMKRLDSMDQLETMRAVAQCQQEARMRAAAADRGPDKLDALLTYFRDEFPKVMVKAIRDAFEK